MPLIRPPRPQDKVVDGWTMRWCEKGKHWTFKCYFGFNQALPEGRTLNCCIHEAEYQNERAEIRGTRLRRRAVMA